MNNLNLCLHCGSRSVDRQFLGTVQTPSGTETHRPISHLELVTTVEAQLSTVGNMRIVNETFGVTADGMEMFGLLQVANGVSTGTDYAYVLGLRNANNKKFPAGVCVGSGVFVCDNLAFSSEIVLARKHTKEILADLPALVGTAIGKLADHWLDQNARIEAYKKIELTNKEAMVLIMEAGLEEEVFPWTKGYDIWQEWKAPKHPEFKERTLWSLFNCVTENLKPRKESKATSLWSLPNRTGRLHLLCDAKAGLNLQLGSQAEIVSAPVVEVPAV
jgi:hypothetical protein